MTCSCLQDFALIGVAAGCSGKMSFGDFTPVAIGYRALDVLAFLVARHGQLASKDAIIQAVWPDVVVEEKNLTVQISTLRRVLDDGRSEPSCIRTESGRGYRFVAEVRRLDEDPGVSIPPVPAAEVPVLGGTTDAEFIKSSMLPLTPAARDLPWALILISLATLLLAFGLGTAWWLRLDRPAHLHEAARDPAQYVSAPVGLSRAPRLSLVVLPFQNLSGDPSDNYLAEGITDDLTTDLSHISGAFVIARESAYTYKGKATDVRQIGHELGVRYVIEGSVRKIDSILRVNIQLISTETGAHLWSDRFDEEIRELAAGQEQVVTRMKDQLGISLVEIESARALRERPTSPDAFDLILQARALRQQPPSRLRDKETLALYERALVLDPSSVSSLIYVAYYLIDGRSWTGDWASYENMQRAEQLLAQARAIAPGSAEVLNTTVLWLRSVGRCPEVIAAAERAIRTDPNRMRMWTGVYNELAVCKTWTGHADEEIALQAEANRLNPRSPWMFNRYHRMGFAALMLGRDQDAVTFLQQSLAINPEGDLHWVHRMLTAAYARSGRMEEARRSLAEADRIFPYDTVRSHFPDNPSSTVYTEQVRGYQAGLRLAGERDHAEEDTDFGVPSDGALQSKVAGRTPTGAPGVRTIRTADLVPYLAEVRPIVIDTVSNSWGYSIPGAVGLKFVGLGGSVTDAGQDRLRSKMQQLTAGDLNRPIVAVGWNAERFDGRNLALRLAALGYANIYWYRGGREAWEVKGLPETELSLQDW